MIIDIFGMILKDRYFIIEQLGKGGQGNLYLARDLELGTLWAVKELPIERKKEAKLLKLLSHPSLPKMTDYIERDGNCYLVMEYIQGKSLREWLEEGRVFSIKEILKIGIEIAKVLEYFHSQKPAVLYGDLKPDNIMLTESGHLYLVDLGSAVMDYSGRLQVCSGTAGYAAPEQFEGRMTMASDVFAFGKTLSVLCGKHRICYKMKNPSWGFFLWRCCQREERFRYQGMAVVRKKMEQMLDNSRKLGFPSGWFLAMLSFGLVCGLVVVWMPAERKPMEEALTSVTTPYYEKMFLDGDTGVRKWICEGAKEKLHQLLKEYPEKEYQRRILLLLALNGELEGDAEHAAVYYEQLLLYDAEFGEAYGRYGLFLYRQGLYEESRRLWEQYCELKSKGGIEKMNDITWKTWRERVGENK